MTYVINTVITIYIVGMIALTVLSIVGLVYLTKMSFSSEPTKMTKTQKNIARMTIVLLWIEVVWILIFRVIQLLVLGKLTY